MNSLKTLDNLVNDEGKTKAEIKKFVKDLDTKDETKGFYDNLCFDILDDEGLLHDDF